MSYAEEKKPYPQKAREKIAASKALDRLIKAMNGDIELTPVQANIGLNLLKKVVPDQKAVETTVTGEVGHTHAVDEQSVEEAARNVIKLINAARAGGSEKDA